MKKLNLFYSIIIFLSGAGLLIFGLFNHSNSAKVDNTSENFPQSRSYILKQRIEAIEAAQKKGQKEYQFKSSFPFPFSTSNSEDK